MRRLLGILMCCALPLAAAQAPLTIRLAAEEWPPFVTPTLPDDGVSAAMTRAVLDRLGYRARIDYFPWKRAMDIGLRDTRYAGLLVVYRTAEREALCHFSAPVANTAMVLAWLKDQPVRAGRLADLGGVRIGTVDGYSNGAEFDALVRARQLDVEEGVSDETNLRKLLARRFPVMVIERHVLWHLLATRFPAAERNRIVTDGRLFSPRTMHICFRRSPEGQRQQQAFDDAARAIDLVKFETEYWRRTGQPDSGN
jgi:polar amino acid transport system substrate-binding protein